MIQLVMTDLDQTLINDQGIITEKNIQAIKLLKEKNILFGMASGRAKSSIQNIAKAFDIYSYVDFIVSYNGVSLYTKSTDEDYSEGFLAREIIGKIYADLKDMDVSFVVHTNDGMICSKVTQYTEEERKLNNYKQIVVEDFNSILDKDYPKLMITGNTEVLNQAMARIDKYSSNFSYFKSHKSFLEVVTQDLSKGRMLKLLCAKNNIDLKKVLSIGDNYNDLEMIKVCGYGVAVGNAVDELKRNAKLLVGSNNEDGFAQAINYYI